MHILQILLECKIDDVEPIVPTLFYESSGNVLLNFRELNLYQKLLKIIIIVYSKEI